MGILDWFQEYNLTLRWYFVENAHQHVAVNNKTIRARKRSTILFLIDQRGSPLTYAGELDVIMVENSLLLRYKDCI